MQIGKAKTLLQAKKIYLFYISKNVPAEKHLQRADSEVL